MKLHATLYIAMLLIGLVTSMSQSQAQNADYSETRKLLLKMERRAGNKELKKLFEEADVRMPDLINGLNDPEKQVSVNAQVIIKYLADPAGLRALDDWYKEQQAKGGEYSMPKLELLEHPKYLQGSDSNLARLATKNKKMFEASRFNSGDVWIRVIAYNKRSKAALLEVVQGEIFTAGWHAVIREENNRWVLLSDNNVWVS